MTTVEATELTELKARTREMWAAGNFAEVARRLLWDVGERLVQRVGVGRGERVLDVACGTGNAAIRAAQAGGDVVGVDLTPELFDAGRRLAADAGVTVDWREGDAEALPFADASFDVVLSVFGCMFAPRHQVAAAELARVLRPGGRLGICSWSTDGVQAKLFRTIGDYTPPPPPFAQPPILWGAPEHVQDLFAGTGIRLEFERDSVDQRFESAEESVAFIEENFGPLIRVREMLTPRQWDELRGRLVAEYDDAPATYVVTIGRKLA